MTNSLMGHALAAARRGFRIFPVEPGGKTPGRIYPNRPASEAPWTIKWSEVATDHVPTIVNWWNASPMSNIGIACAPSGLLVVDCDLKPGDGLAEWQDICQKFCKEDAWEVWDTYTVNTGSGGAHFYYRWPPGAKASQKGLSLSVDIRSNGGSKGGYVLSAGSITNKGSYEPDNDTHVHLAPAWLVELCRERPRPQPIRSAYEKAGPLSYTGLVLKVATCPSGDRNNVLLWAARAMCSDGATESEAMELLIPAAIDNGLTEREAMDTLKSGYRLQRRKDGR